MERIKCTISYDGTNFAGYQVQPNLRTVQSAIEAVLKKMHNKDIRITASGRTDAFVHALGQVIHFDTSLNIPAEQWKRALNTQLPDDISIVQVEKVADNFHARYDVTKKEYRYRISTQKDVDVFKRLYTYHYPYELNMEKMKEAAVYFVGTHDFTLFCSARTEVVDKVRTIYEVRMEQQGDEIEIAFVGNGFLYNMVRILVGVILAAGQGRIEPHEVKDVLEKQDRKLSTRTAPGHGLYLWKVYYS